MNIQSNTPPEKDYLHKSWTERYEFTRAFSVIPALFCMIFLRLDVGYRMIKVHWLAVAAACAVAAPVVATVGLILGVLGIIAASSNK